MADKKPLTHYTGTIKEMVAGDYLDVFNLKLRNAANTFVNAFANATTAARTWTFPDKDITVAGIDDIATDDSVKLGWIALGACTYETADSPTFQFSIAADVTAFIGVGNRIKLTQTTVKYFIVTAVGAFSGGKTIITVYGGTDYTLANAAITSPFFSIAKAPFGFPLSEIKWRVRLIDTSLRRQDLPVTGTVYNLGSLSISAPIGIWKPVISALIYAYREATLTNIFIALSTANNSISNTAMMAEAYSTSTIALQSVYKTDDVITVASKTTYYLVEKTDAADEINLAGTIIPTTVDLICAYL